MSNGLKIRVALPLLLAVLFVLHLLQIVIAQPMFPPGGNHPMYYVVMSVLSTLNTILLLVLLAMYVSAYRDTKSEFLVGLIVFDLAMLLYVVSSNPFVRAYFGVQEIGPAPFVMLPDFFILVAVVALLVQAFRYR